MRCLKCGNDNLEPAHLCQVCRAVLPEAPDQATPAHNAGSGAEQPVVTLLYQALIGPVHTDYYLRHFARFDAAGKAGPSWHWPTFFATLGWLVFRRMWGVALGFAALSLAGGLLLFGVGPLVWGVSQEVLWAAWALFVLAVCVLPALWANALYYRHCNRLVTQALVAAPDVRQACERLADHASTGRRAWVAAELTLGVWVAALALGAWLATASPGTETLAAATAIALRGAASSPTPPSSAPPMDEAASAAPATASATMPIIPEPAASGASVTPAALTVAAASATAAASAAREAASAKPEAAAPSSGASKQGKHIVAVGQFAQEQNASRAYDKLAAAGLPVHSNAVQTPAGTLLLIRVGPFMHLEQARAAAQQIKALGLPAVVMKR